MVYKCGRAGCVRSRAVTESHVFGLQSRRERSALTFGDSLLGLSKKSQTVVIPYTFETVVILTLMVSQRLLVWRAPLDI